MKYSVQTLFYCMSIITCALLFGGCAQRAAFQPSLVVPAASGKVKVKKDDNNNYTLSLEVRDLTTPDKLTPPKNAYIVWSEASNGVFNIGQLVSSRSFLARGFKAELTATLPSKPKRIFITAEDNTNTLAPGPAVVLSTGDF